MTGYLLTNENCCHHFCRMKADAKHNFKLKRQQYTTKVIHKQRLCFPKKGKSFKTRTFIVLRFQLTHQHVLTEKEFIKIYLYCKINKYSSLPKLQPNGAEKLMYGAHVVVWRQQK